MDEIFWKRITASLSSTMLTLDVQCSHTLAVVAELRAELDGLCPSAMCGSCEMATLDMLSPSSITPVLLAAASDPMTAAGPG
jgi:hypothetical protein